MPWEYVKNLEKQVNYASHFSCSQFELKNTSTKFTFPGSFLAPFTSFSEYETFYRRVLSSPAVMKYCYHGGRVIHWLPYQGWDDINGEVNVTYFKSNQPLIMHNAWRRNNPKNSERPYCVVARMGNKTV